MTDAHELWFRRLSPGVAPDISLYCFPHAGGSASFFRPLAERFPPWASVIGVQYPGRQDRRTEPPPESITESADRIFTLLAGRPGPPPVLYGHSMGAVIAYEVARRMEGAGAGPAALVVSGRRAPSISRPERVHLDGDDGTIAEIAALAGTAPHLLADEEFRQMILPAVRADYRAIEQYREAPGPGLTCPINALMGESDPRVTLDEARAWREHTDGPFSIRSFPGGHFFVADRVAEVVKVMADDLAPLARGGAEDR
ncbi:thioesterase II family protein [Actinomadura geliboluensis]|uniref:thioesterase II family protein n=1 Tax=Actinomadura geliboluensis TaxID=882440 RepID=UPI0036C1ED3A